MADTSMLLLGGKLKFKESLSGRLGDVLSQLYIASAMLKRYEDEGRPGVRPAAAGLVVPRQRAQDRDRVLGGAAQLPDPSDRLAAVAAGVPWGRRAQAPSDRLGHSARRC
jgi:acyl-CoA dehydrogenase